MSDSPVLFSRKGAVATITLNRPQHGNSITREMIAMLLRFLYTSERDPTIRVLVLTGNGKYFCTGMDLKSKGGAPALTNSKAPKTDGKATSDFGKPYAVFEALYRCTKPVVGVMNGPALGGGVGILFACDIRIASGPHCFISFPEASLGIYPALISGYIAPQLGAYTTQYLMMTGDKCSAKTLVDRGVLTTVCGGETTSVDAERERICQMLLRAPTSAITGVKRLVHLVCYCGEYHEEVMGELVSEFGAMVRSPEARFGMGHFKKHKKSPNWDADYYSGKAQKQDQPTQKAKL